MRVVTTSRKSLLISFPLGLVAVLSGPCTASAQGFHINIGGSSYAGGSYRTSSYSSTNQLFRSDEARFQEGILSGDVEKVRQYIKPEYVDKPFRGFPPISYAACHGNTKVITLLVENGASVKYRCHDLSLAYYAEALGFYDTAATLVRYGGGTKADLAAGRARQVAMARHRKEQAKELAQVLTLTGAALSASQTSSQSSDGHISGTSFSDRDAENAYMRNEQARRDADH